MSPSNFDQIYHKILDFLDDKKIYVRDMFAGADKTHRLRVRFINTLAWHNLFCYNMFLQPESYKLETFTPEFTVICCPDFTANPESDGVRQKNFTIINFSKKLILIGGTHYSGQIKKRDIFRFKLPSSFKRKSTLDALLRQYGERSYGYSDLFRSFWDWENNSFSGSWTPFDW